MENKSFLEYLFGTNNYTLFIVMILIAYICQFIKIHRQISKAIKVADNLTPNKWSWSYWKKDGNIGKIISNIFTVFILLRFVDFLILYSPIKNYVPIDNAEARIFASAVIGLGSEWFFEWLRGLGLFGTAPVPEEKKE